MLCLLSGVAAVALWSALLPSAQNAAGDAPIVGTWAGTARTGAQIADVAFDIRSTPRGPGLRMTLPPLRAWGMPVGILATSGDGWSIPDWQITCRRDGDALVGTLGDPRVTYRLTRVDRVPAEPAPPATPTGPPRAWRYETRGPVWGALAVRGDTVFGADVSGRVHAVRAKDGTVVWTFDAGAPIFGAPLVTPESVVILDESGVLHALAPATGRVRWKTTLEGADPGPRSLPGETAFEFDYQSPTPVESEGIVFISSPKGVVHAIEASSGRVRWRHALSARVRATASVDRRHVYVAALDHRVHALDRSSGRPVWSFDTKGPATSPPVIAGDLVLAGSRSSWLTALRAESGAPVWSLFHWFSWVEAAGVVVGDTYYVGSSDLRAVRAVDVRTGTVKWETDVRGWAWGAPVIVDDTIYMGTAGARAYVTAHEGGLLALDRATGRIRWRNPAPKPADAFVSGYPGSVVLAGGLLIAGSVNGGLDATRIRADHTDLR